MPLPKFTPTLTDGNLERAEQSGVFNRHVVILGTSVDGPMYTPVTIRDLDHAETVFGAFGTGTLVRALNECWQAQTSRGKSPLITAMRIGDAIAGRASLDLASADTNDGTALTLEAYYSGDKYNSISIAQDTSLKTFKIYNPKSGLWSTFKYDWDNPNNASVHAHNLVELAAAINSDTNMRDILIATVPEKTAQFELLLNSTNDADIIVSTSDTETKLDISLVGTGDYVTDSLYLDGTSMAGVDPTNYTTKPIVSVNSIYAISDSGIELFTGGSTAVKAAKMPLPGRNDTRFNTLLNVITPSAPLTTLAQDPGSGDLTSEGYFRVRGVTVGQFDKDNRTVAFDAQLGIADYAASNTGMLGPSKVASSFHSAKGYDADYTAANLGSGFQELVRWNKNGVETTGGTYPIKVEMRKAGGGPTDWETMDLSAGTWSLSWNSTTLKATLTIPEDGGSVNLTDYDNGDIRVGYDSCIGIFTEKTNLAAVTASTAFTDYFVRGKEFVFGAALPQNTVFRYATVTYYEMGSTVNVTNAQTGKITLSGANIQPGPGGGAIGAQDSILGFNYVYAPTSPTLTSAQSLAGGKNGVSLTNTELYEELESGFDNLEGLNFALMVTPGAYIDSTKTGYNANSGLSQTVNADFHGLVKTFIESHNREAQCIMSFAPLTGTGPNSAITRTDISNRAKKLSIVDYSDELRAANYLTGFNCKAITSVDLEAYFRGKGVRYTNTAEAAVAGHLAMLRDEETMYLDPITGILSAKYTYSDRMTSGTPQLDALSDARINAGVQEARGVRLSDGITLAATTSDYHLEATMRAVNASVRDVRDVAGAFLGKPNTLQTLQALETAINTKLSIRVPSSLVSFTFTVKSSPAQRVIGQIEIPLTLVPVFEIRDIQVPVVLKSDVSNV